MERFDIIEPTERIGGPVGPAHRWTPPAATHEDTPTTPTAESDAPVPGALAHLVLRDAALRGIGVEPLTVAE